MTGCLGDVGILVALAMPDFRALATLAICLVVAWLAGGALAGWIQRKTKAQTATRHGVLSIRGLLWASLAVALALALTGTDPKPALYLLMMIPPITLFNLMVST